MDGIFKALALGCLAVGGTAHGGDWTLFGGVGGGLGAVGGGEFAQNPAGAQVLLSSALSYSRDRWVTDGGLSWFFSEVKGEDSAGNPLQMRTRAALADWSVRYRWNRWQGGPVMQVAFGTDTSFSSGVNEAGANGFVGWKTVYEFQPGGIPLRFWQQISTDVSIPGRQVYLGLVGVQVGFGMENRRHSLPDSLVLRAAHSTPAPSAVTVVLDPGKIFFQTNSSELKPEAQSVLQKVAKYLENSAEFEHLEIAGHADRRGTYRHNLNLSERRARAVSEALGLDKNLTAVKGYSYTRPLDGTNTPEAWAKNRRVELVFEGVHHVEQFQGELAELMVLAPTQEGTQR